MEYTIDALFKDKTFDAGRLLAFGFVKSEGGYVYSVPLSVGQLEMRVDVSGQGRVSAAVTDASSGEKYVLHRVPLASGSFVERVREEYGKVLSDISEHCFERDVFKSEGAKRVIRYAREKYGDELEYLWEKFPTNAVLRRKDTAKWYAALIVLPKSKLGMDDDGVTDILDLRMDADRGDVAVDGRRYFPAYHMNKKTWFTVCLDGSVPLEEVFRRIDASYDLAGKKK